MTFLKIQRQRLHFCPPQVFWQNPCHEYAGKLSDIRRNSRELFDGLQIMNRTEICEKWMNQYPVLFLSLKDVEGTSFENAFGLLKFLFPRSVSLILILGHPLQTYRVRASVLTKTMQEYYKKPVILLMDEYFGFTGNDVKRLLNQRILKNMERESKAGMTDIILVMLTCIVPGCDELCKRSSVDPDARPVVIGKIPAATVLSGRLLILQETVLPENWRL